MITDAYKCEAMIRQDIATMLGEREQHVRRIAELDAVIEKWQSVLGPDKDEGDVIDAG